jgi:cytoskeletal protein RodZ
LTLKLPKLGRKKKVIPEEITQEKTPEQDEVEEPVKEPSQPAAGSSRSSLEIFKEVGRQMRLRREKLGLSLSDVEQFTRLRRMYLQAIEEGRFEDLPSSVQGRGMVTNYAHFLEMDQDAVSNLYAEGLESQRREKLRGKWAPREPTIRVSVRLPEKLRRLLSPDLLFGSLVVVALFVFIFWGASQIFGGRNDTTPTAAPSISEMLQNTTPPQ